MILKPVKLLKHTAVRAMRTVRRGRADRRGRYTVFAQCYGKTGNDEYLQISKRVANYFIASIGSNYIPRCDFRQPAEPDIIDTTAGTVAASAFISLAEYTPENERAMYLDAACNILSAYDKKNLQLVCGR